MMKKVILVLSLFFICAFSVNAQNNVYSEIRGTVTGQTSEVALMKIVDGKFKDVAKVITEDEKEFVFVFKATEGFYIIFENVKGLNTVAEVYVKPGENISMNINTADGTSEIVGRCSEENRILNKWTSYIKDIKKGAIYFMLGNNTYETFFPLLSKIGDEYKAYMGEIKTKNSQFNSLMELKMDFDLNYYACAYFGTPRAKHPEQKDVDECKFYQNIELKPNFKHPRYYELPNSGLMISAFTRNYVIRVKKMSSTDAVEGVLSLLATDSQKGEFLIERCSRITAVLDFREFASKYEKYMVTQELKEKFEKYKNLVDGSREGEVAPDFTYTDITGKMVSLSDFKGKVVLIDVWATWCGPCMKEIPYLRNLEKEFEGNDNIVFMAVSVDDEKNKEKWEKTVVENKVGGIQLFAGKFAGSKIATDYAIKGIPRFILVDKSGKIISIDAPRPSNQQLKSLISKHLKN